jgi:hypothetical protein
MRSCAAAACILLLLGGGPVAATYSAGHAIVVRRGQTHATAAGRFVRPFEQVSFTLRARAGQHLSVRIDPLDERLNIAGYVIAPSGKRDGGPGGLIFDGDLSETGKYRIEVQPRNHSGPGTFHVQVDLRPSRSP